MIETTQTAETCDDAVVETIVEGRYSVAGKAIGQANLPTVQRAAQRCSERYVQALAAAEPCQQYHDRALLCRRRVALLTKPAASF